MLVIALLEDAVTAAVLPAPLRISSQKVSLVSSIIPRYSTAVFGRYFAIYVQRSVLSVCIAVLTVSIYELTEYEHFISIICINIMLGEKFAGIKSLIVTAIPSPTKFRKDVQNKLCQKTLMLCKK